MNSLETYIFSIYFFLNANYTSKSKKSLLLKIHSELTNAKKKRKQKKTHLDCISCLLNI